MAKVIPKTLLGMVGRIRTKSTNAICLSVRIPNNIG
uniref:Uncharacterized protein n=1 Tax=Arundo donax TaxID=35708 RepID=A0A0A9ARB4_ARUDO